MPKPIVNVAVGVVFDINDRVLIAKRRPGQHLAGMWEFPGGKIEADESPVDALCRELREELGVIVRKPEPLISFVHCYSDRTVKLCVYTVSKYDGAPVGLEGQEISWISVEGLDLKRFPQANRPIISSLKLPDRYAIVDLSSNELSSAIEKIRSLIERDIRLIRLRASGLDYERYASVASYAADICKQGRQVLMLDTYPELVLAVGASGLHLSSVELHRMQVRPLDASYWIAASCHNTADLSRSAQLGVDFAVLGPVKPTQTHPEAKPIGWRTFKNMVESAIIPVFALGGLTVNDIPDARRNGGQGDSAIRGLP